MGSPKALVELDGEPLVRRAVAVLADAGCAPLVVVVGAAAGAVTAVLPAGVVAVPAPDWAEGMGASLRAGLTALIDGADAADAAGAPVAAVVHLVDLPGVSAAAVARLAADATPDRLARATYRGRAGHPVLLGREHWAAVRDAARGDAGARGYLADHPYTDLVECADLADGTDVDTPDALRAARVPTRRASRDT